MRKIYLIFCLLLANIAYAQVEPIGTARLKANGSTVTVAGIVTNDAAHDNRNRNRSFQDATGGLNIFAQNTPAAPTLQSLKPGDSIVVTGVLAEFNNLKQLVEPLTITRVAENKRVPSPVIVTMADLANPAIAEPLESMLVRVEDVVFDTRDAIFGSGTSGRSYDIDDPKNPVPGNCFPVSADCNNGPVVRINPGNPLVGVDVPRGTVSVSGNLGQFAAAYQIVVRGRQDLELGLVIENVRQNNIQLNSFNLSFTTNQRAKTRVRWGTIFLVDVNTSDATNYVADYDTTFVGEINVAELKTNHSIDITGLNEASLYFVEIFCQNAEGNKNTIFADVYGTASQSTGEIKVFFNKTVDVSVSRNGATPIVTTDMAQVIADYIDRANESVDVAIYNMNTAGGAKIATALNAARTRGVQVRFIFAGEPANTGLSLLSGGATGIPKLRDRNTTGAAALQRTGTGNHNKFIVIDPNSRLNSFVITGSGNFTDNNLFTDPNNFLVIQDQTLARAYRAEFDEMWGEGPVNPNSTATVGTSPDFNRQKMSRMGAQKIKNTPSKFLIGERLVELFFSPSDKTTNAIRKALYSTDNDMRFALLLITSDDLRTPIDSMQNVGWDVKGLIDDENAVPENSTLVPGSDYFWLRDRGVNVNAYTSATTQLHHKYAVIDAVRTNSDPQVVTGSHNWSSSAETSNDENTLIIHDAKIANMYRQEFAQRWFEATGIRDAYLLALDEPIQESGAVIYPNPSQGDFAIQFDRAINSSIEVRILDLQGKLVQQQQMLVNGKKMAMGTDLPKGMYVLQISLEGKTFTRKLVVAK
jgi:phosphatidylserine/phosphatidylglycerophosphate/cardiolipin synthase-like enzyme